MAGNSSKVVEFFNGSMYMKAVLVEEAPDEGALCCLCLDPLHGLPFYTTEPQMFDVHLRCVDYYYAYFLHVHGDDHDQLEKSSSPAAPANHHYKHDDKQLAGFQYPWQPQSNVYHAQPPPLYRQYPYYEQPPNPWQPQPNVYGNVYHAQPPPYAFHDHPYNYGGHGQPPNPSVYQSYSCYPPPAYGSGSINQQAAAAGNNNNNQVWKPSKWGTSAAAMRIGSIALAAFLQALFGIALPTWLPFGNS